MTARVTRVQGAVEHALDGIDGLVRGGAVFGADPDAPAWWCNGTEVAHFDDGGRVLDVRLGRKVITELRREGLAIGEGEQVRRRSPSSGWVEVALPAAARGGALRRGPRPRRRPRLRPRPRPPTGHEGRRCPRPAARRTPQAAAQRR